MRGWLWLALAAGCVPRERDDATPAVPVVFEAPDVHDWTSQAPPPPEDTPLETLAIPVGARMVQPGVRAGIRAFSDSLVSEGSLWVGPLRGNGGREAIIFVPRGLRTDQPIEWVVHFHGTYSENFAEPTEAAPKKTWVGWNRLQQTIDAISEVQAKGARNVALLYPISAGQRLEPGVTGWSNKMYDRMWMKTVEGDDRYVDNFETMLDEAAVVLEREFGVSRGSVSPLVLAEGHSAGGIALRNVAESGTSRVAEYLFLDASFQDWADGCHAAIRDQGRDAQLTLVITDRGIADPFGKRDPWCARLEGAAQRWPKLQERCAGMPERKTGFAGLTCSTHLEAAEAWPRYARWCAAMKTDMRGEPGVYVLRTKVPHGKQPRRFSGGLSVPVERFERRSTGTPGEGP